MELRRIKYILALCFLLIIVFYFVTYIFFDVKITHEHRYYVPNFSKTIYDVDYVLNSSSCGPTQRTLIIITSYAGHIELRSAHRRAFPADLLNELGIKRVFLLAKLPPSDKSLITQLSIVHEQGRFGDILQGNFIEHYRNLTIKHIMGLKWSSIECSNVKVIIKLDDDIVIDIPKFFDYLNSVVIHDRSKFLMGYVMRGMKPIRIKANKWYVSKKEYSKSYYSPFLSGWIYVTTPEVAKILIHEAYNLPYFWIDDVHITGTLATKCNIRVRDFRYDNILLEYFELLDCCMKDMIDKNIKCDYLAGPNGNDDNMIVKFNDAIRNCHNCVNRPIDKPLNETCVSMKNNKPLHSGNPVVNVIRL